MNLVSSRGVYQCHEVTPQPTQGHLDELVERIHRQDQLGLDKPLVHIIDREADSLPHLRQLMNTRWLTRCKKDSTLLHDGKSKRVEQIASCVPSEVIGRVSLRGRVGFLFVGETLVSLKRKTESRPDELVTARLVLSRVVDEAGKELASWYLLSNVTEVSAREIAQPDYP